MKDILKKLEHIRIIPIVRIDVPRDASALGNALMSGGIPAAEITFRSTAAAECIRTLRLEFSDMLVGAGTVLSVASVKQAVDAGAEFIMTPGFNPKVVDYCLERDIPVIPGVNSPTQVEMGLERGLSILKFFPAEASGGIKMIKALVNVYPEVSFIPAGGINRQNILTYLKCEGVLACGGSWLVNYELISTGAFDEIIVLVSDVVALIRSALLDS